MLLAKTSKTWQIQKNIAKKGQYYRVQKSSSKFEITTIPTFGILFKSIN